MYNNELVHTTAKRQTETDNASNHKNIGNIIGTGVSPELTVQEEIQNIVNDRPAHILKPDDKATKMSMIMLVHTLWHKENLINHTYYISVSRYPRHNYLNKIAVVKWLNAIV